MTYPLKQERLHSSKDGASIQKYVCWFFSHFPQQKEEGAADVGKAVSMFGL